MRMGARYIYIRHVLLAGKVWLDHETAAPTQTNYPNRAHLVVV